ncbi:adenylate/guanylate cyclase domain-containing protein [bacterium]|nr:adenylate/guanylate cyclase domain-containing protein [bacterium]
MKKLKSLFIFISFAIIIFVAYIIFSSFFEPGVYNLMVRNFVASQKGSDGIVLIVIDDESIERYRWPWSRDLYAKIFEYLGHYANAKIIGFDAVLTTPDANNPASDLQLYNTVKDIDNFVGGFSLLNGNYPDVESGKLYDKKFEAKFGYPINTEFKPQERPRYNSLSRYPDGYFNALKRVGCVKVFTHPIDGYIKDIPQLIYYKGNYYPSLGLRMFAYLNNTKEIKLTKTHLIISGDEEIKIKYHRRWGGICNFLHFYKNYKNSDYTHRTYSAVDILDSIDAIKAGKKPKIDPKSFDNKIVYVGANAKAQGLGLEDAAPTPMHNKHPGVDIQATNLDNLIHNQVVRSVTANQEFLLNLILVVAAFIIVARFSLIAGLGVMVLLVLGYIFMSVLAYKLDFAVPVITPIALQMVTMIFGYSWKFIVESRNKEKIKDAMGKYISQDIMENVVSNIDNVKLGGKKADVTVLFADIRGFTSMSEKLEPDEISVILNEYFTALEPIISSYNGVINKFIGDAIMAIFGEPIQDKDHAVNAVKCANAMLLKVQELQKKWIEEGKPKIEIGVGINTGEAFVGNIGSEKRLEYTVIGDMVNLASRIESYNKVYKTQFLISSSTYEHVRGIADVIKISEVKIRGKEKKMNIYEVLRLTK